MPDNYVTIIDKLTKLGVSLKSIDTYQLSQDLRSSGATVAGYTTNEENESIDLLYDNSEAFDGALERCGVSLPKKKPQAALDSGKGRERKVEKVEESDSEVTA